MKQTVKILANVSIWILHLFITADCGFMGVFQQRRGHRYNAWPYLCYSFLRFLTLGMLLVLHVKYTELNRKPWYAFLLVDDILFVCPWKGCLLYPQKILLTVMGVLLAQLWGMHRQLGQGREMTDI